MQIQLNTKITYKFHKKMHWMKSCRLNNPRGAHENRGMVTGSGAGHCMTGSRGSTDIIITLLVQSTLFIKDANLCTLLQVTFSPSLSPHMWGIFNKLTITQLFHQLYVWKWKVKALFMAKLGLIFWVKFDRQTWPKICFQVYDHQLQLC